MLIETLTMDFRKARAVKQVSTSFVVKVPTKTEPAGDAGTDTGSSIIELGKDAMICQNSILLVPYGIGAKGTTFSVRVIGWRRIGNLAQTLLWIPVNIAELLCTISNVTGVAGCVVLDTEKFVDTITVTTASTLGGERATESIVSPANDTIAHAVVDLKGFQKVELSFSTGASATSANALIALL